MAPHQKQADTVSQDFPYIRLWGRMMGSMSYYIEDQLRLARRTNAPVNATYYREGHPRNNGWQTTDDISNWQTRRYLGLRELTPAEIAAIEVQSAKDEEAGRALPA